MQFPNDLYASSAAGHLPSPFGIIETRVVLGGMLSNDSPLSGGLVYHSEGS